jgi:hypothetical protein
MCLCLKQHDGVYVHRVLRVCAFGCYSCGGVWHFVHVRWCVFQRMFYVICIVYVHRHIVLGFFYTSSAKSTRILLRGVGCSHTELATTAVPTLTTTRLAFLSFILSAAIVHAGVKCTPSTRYICTTHCYSQSGSEQEKAGENHRANQTKRTGQPTMQQCTALTGAVPLEPFSA